jgi:hypothetical protein
MQDLWRKLRDQDTGDGSRAARIPHAAQLFVWLSVGKSELAPKDVAVRRNRRAQGMNRP